MNYFYAIMALGGAVSVGEIYSSHPFVGALGALLAVGGLIAFNESCKEDSEIIETEGRLK
jgi:hypothetical protein